jgi:hypothetical protein
MGMPVGCSLKPRGIIVLAITSALSCKGVGNIERRKRPTIANAAVARELAGWAWSLAVMDD